jgi:hypothetical protein
MVVIHEVLFVALLARGLLNHHSLFQPDCLRSHRPRLRENRGILHGRFVGQRITLAGVSLDDMQRRAVKISADTQPGVKTKQSGFATTGPRG